MTAKLLIGTDICIFAMKRRDRELLAKLRAHASVLAVSDISIFELAYGAEGYADRERRFREIDTFKAFFMVLPFDTQAAMHAGAIRAKLKSRGEMIGVYDCLIAGIARARGLTLVTRNQREFMRVEGLVLENWA